MADYFVVLIFLWKTYFAKLIVLLGFCRSWSFLLWTACLQSINEHIKLQRVRYNGVFNL